MPLRIRAKHWAPYLQNKVRVFQLKFEVCRRGHLDSLGKQTLKLENKKVSIMKLRITLFHLAHTLNHHIQNCLYEILTTFEIFHSNATFSDYLVSGLCPFTRFVEQLISVEPSLIVCASENKEHY